MFIPWRKNQWSTAWTFPSRYTIHKFRRIIPGCHIMSTLRTIAHRPNIKICLFRFLVIEINFIRILSVVVIRNIQRWVLECCFSFASHFFFFVRKPMFVCFCITTYTHIYIYVYNSPKEYVSKRKMIESQ